MGDWISGGLLGSLFGGIFRILPEVLKFFDRKGEREHELLMFSKQLEFENLYRQYRVEERYVDYSVEQLKSLGDAFKEQSATAVASYRWVAAISALVRPALTMIFVGLYVSFKVTMMVYALDSGVPWITVISNHWTEDDFSILMMIITFWMLGRPIEKYRNGQNNVR